MDNSDSLKFWYKNRSWENDIEMVAIYVTLFINGTPEVLLKIITILNKIIKGQDLSRGLHKYGMTRNLVIKESLRGFDQKTRDFGTETNTN